MQEKTASRNLCSWQYNRRLLCMHLFLTLFLGPYYFGSGSYVNISGWVENTVSCLNYSKPQEGLAGNLDKNHQSRSKMGKWWDTNSRDSQAPGMNHEASRLPGQPHHIYQAGSLSRKQDPESSLHISALTLKTLHVDRWAEVSGNADWDAGSSLDLGFLASPVVCTHL